MATLHCCTARHRVLPLVCRRWARLAYSLELLAGELEVHLSRAYIPPRFAALCAFLHRCAGAGARALRLTLHGGPPSDEGMQRELISAVGACGAGGRLQQLSLRLGEGREPAMLGSQCALACGPGLRQLSIAGGELLLGAPLGGLTGLHCLALTGRLNFPSHPSLPSCLRELALDCCGFARDLPAQVPLRLGWLGWLGWVKAAALRLPWLHGWLCLLSQCGRAALNKRSFGARSSAVQLTALTRLRSLRLVDARFRVQDCDLLARLPMTQLALHSCCAIPRCMSQLTHVSAGCLPAWRLSGRAAPAVRPVVAGRPQQPGQPKNGAIFGAYKL